MLLFLFAASATIIVDYTELNGVETYIKQQLDAKSLDWIPSRTSAAIEKAVDGAASTTATSVAASASAAGAAADPTAEADAASLREGGGKDSDGGEAPVSRLEFAQLRDDIMELRDLFLLGNQRAGSGPNAGGPS